MVMVHSGTCSYRLDEVAAHALHHYRHVGPVSATATGEFFTMRRQTHTQRSRLSCPGRMADRMSDYSQTVTPAGWISSCGSRIPTWSLRPCFAHSLFLENNAKTSTSATATIPGAAAGRGFWKDLLSHQEPTNVLIR